MLHAIGTHVYIEPNHYPADPTGHNPGVCITEETDQPFNCAQHPGPPIDGPTLADEPPAEAYCEHDQLKGYCWCFKSEEQGM